MLSCCINLYLDETEALRHDVNSMFSLAMLPTQTSVTISIDKESIRSCTQERYLHRNFETHSLRSSSKSNSFRGSLFLTEIVKTTGWTNVKVFGKVYNKPVILVTFW